MARKFLYKIGIGREGMAFKYYTVEAANMQEARIIGLRTYMHPDLGYDHIEVTRVRKEGKKNA